MMPTENPLHRRFFGSHLASPAIKRCLREAKHIRIATAFFEPSGWDELSDVLVDKHIELLVGREEGMDDRIEILLQEFIEQLERSEFSDKTKLLKSIHQALSSGKLVVRISKRKAIQTLDIRYLYHHAKLYMADEVQLIVTSANFTRQGLRISKEAGYLVKEKSDVLYFVQSFDAFFKEAEPLNEPFLQLIEELLDMRTPFEVYARSLLEIYGMQEDTLASNLPHPAYYQRPIISRLVQTMIEHRGAFLIASTGLGKTIIAAHTVSILRSQNIIQAVMIFSPAGLRDMWARSMRAAKISSREFSYQILSMEDWKKSRQVMFLDDELRRDLSGMLIILDESHHMRNDELNATERRLRHRRIKAAIQKGAQLLLMTATPYSRSVDDINNQLSLFPKTVAQGMFGEVKKYWHVLTPAEVSGLPICTVLTAPTVVTHFSETDEQGERFVLFNNDDKRYFPRRIHLSSVNYQNPMNQTLKKLLQSNLLRRRVENVQSLFDDPGSKGKRDPLFEVRLLHHFCSSPAQAREDLQKLSVEGGYEKMRFEYQTELTKLVQNELKLASNVRIDDKLSQLFSIVAKYIGEKIVIFCIYRETARYLLRELARAFPELKIDTTVDQDPDHLEDTLAFFAPVANDRITPDGAMDEFSQKILEQRIDILVASEAIAEGFNLQDARILINYDLPWSVLHLAQRMGRLMRPWYAPRELHIYNFIPDTMSDPDFPHAENWRNRLDKRNREHQSFATLPVLMASEKEEVSLYSVSAALQAFSETDLNLDEALSFIDNATRIETSTFLDDLAKLEKSEVERILKLRPGFRSRVKKKQNDPALFLLIKRRSSIFSALFNANGDFFSPPERVMDALEKIRFNREEIAYLEQSDSGRGEDFLKTCLKTWLSHFGESAENIQVICSLHFAEA